MNRYPANTDVALSLPCLGPGGTAVATTGCIIEVSDETETVIATLSGTLASDSMSATVTVPAASNVLQPAINPTAPWEAPITGLRTVVATFMTAGGVVTASLDYALFQGPTQLIVLKNSFQTYSQAKLTADGLLNVPNFAAAGDQDRINALMAAYARLTRLGYYVRWPANPDAQNMLMGWDERLGMIDSLLWNVMTTDMWFSYYPQDFRTTLCKAQVTEADDLLAAPDPIATKRAAGIISEKINESSVQFQVRNPLRLGVSLRTMAIISRYVSTRISTTRI